MFTNVAAHIHRVRLFMLALVLIVAGLAAIPVARANERICFPEAAPVIHDCIDGRFAQFWRENGGLPVFGYPITSARMERNADIGKDVLTQYFERQRFELHPDNQRPFDVLLGRLGAEWQKVNDPRSIDQFHDNDGTLCPTAAAYVPETRYCIGSTDKYNLPKQGPWYWTYYSTHGLEFDGKAGTSRSESLMLFGYPLSAIIWNFNVAGESYQVYERTILRTQPDVTDPEWRVVPDRVGVWYYKHVLKADTDNRLVYP